MVYCNKRNATIIERDGNRFKVHIWDTDKIEWVKEKTLTVDMVRELEQYKLGNYSPTRYEDRT